MIEGFKVGKNKTAVIPAFQREKYRLIYLTSTGGTMSYSEIIDHLEAEAAEQKKAVPVFARALPQYGQALELQNRIFNLLREMAKQIEGGNHGGS